MASFKAAKADDDTDVIVRKRLWNAKSRRWGDWKVLLRRSQVAAVPMEASTPVARRTRSHIAQYESAPPAPASFQLLLGGTFHVYPNLISPQRQEELTAELLDNPHLFRQYRIQGGPEPRAHFLLHDQATNDDFDTSMQPGYKYGTITMKARPLSLLPKLETLANEMQDICKVPSWNVGVNPVFYRDNRDHIGMHADNDQGENTILTILIKSPSVVRKVIIQTSHKDSKSKKKQDGDEQYELSMGAGDAYDMDGVMQQHYVHGVPSSSGDQDGRMALVLRHGNYVPYAKDSGRELDNLDPRIVIPRTFGRMNGLIEGDSYSRARIRELGAHCSPQGGISGNKTDGCDAIIVADARKDGLGEDRFDKLMYAADTSVGAAGILTCMTTGKPIRVFRSSSAKQNPYRAMTIAGQPTQYRYDGLYWPVSVSYFDESGIEKRETPDTLSSPEIGVIYQFQFERIPVGNDVSRNEKSNDELMVYAVHNGTLDSDCEAARMYHNTLSWPMSIVIPQPITSDQAALSEPQEDVLMALFPPSILPMSVDERNLAGLLSGQAQEIPCASELVEHDLFENTSEEGVAELYGQFPTPALGESTAVRLVSPSTASFASAPAPAPAHYSSEEKEAADILMQMKEQSPVFSWKPPTVRQSVNFHTSASSTSAMRQARLLCRPSPYIKRPDSLLRDFEQSDMLRIDGVQSAAPSLDVSMPMLDAL